MACDQVEGKHISIEAFSTLSTFYFISATIAFSFSGGFVLFTFFCTIFITGLTFSLTKT